VARGFTPGPEMGKLLEQLYDAQLEGRLEEELNLLCISQTGV
jgi:hypothetical protein